MNTHVIEINALTRRFKETVAVDELSLEVHAGEIFGFLGHNGAGKTTTVRLLNGVIEASAGRMNVLGLDPQADGPRLRARTGVLTETPSLDERLTAWDNLGIYADLYGVPRAEVGRRIKSLLEEFELSDRAGEKVGGFSKGMKQRLALARALLHKPELIFLDEPTSGLDPIASRHVNELIIRLVRRENCTAFLCTHNLVEAQRVCDRVAVMEHGKLVAIGTPAELAQKYVRRLEIELEVGEGQKEAAVQVLQGLPDLVPGTPQQVNGHLVMTVDRRDAIPAVLSCLMLNQIKIFRVAAQEADLEQVYFTLHEEKEGVK